MNPPIPNESDKKIIKKFILQNLLLCPLYIKILLVVLIFLFIKFYFFNSRLGMLVLIF